MHRGVDFVSTFPHVPARKKLIVASVINLEQGDTAPAQLIPMAGALYRAAHAERRCHMLARSQPSPT